MAVRACARSWPASPGGSTGRRRLDGRAVAVTHAGVIKAAVICALDAPVGAFWQVDVAPLTITELHAHGGRWTLRRANHPIARRSG